MARKGRSDKKGKFKKGTKKIFFLQIFISIFKTEKKKFSHTKAVEDNSIIIHQLLYPWIHS